MRGLMRSAPLLLAMAGTMASGLRAQQEHPGAPEGGPRFLLAAAGSSAPVRIEPSRVPMLSERLTVRLEHATLDHALQTISALTGIRLVYSGDVVPLHKRVSLKAEEISVAAALTEVLLGASVDIVISGSNAALVRRAPDQLPGAITGRVTEAATESPIVSAQVSVDGRGRVLTDSDGRYRIDGVEPGLRTVSVTSIGYASASREIEVSDGETVTVDFALDVAPTALNELVVTVTGEQRRAEVGNVIGRILADSLMQVAPVMTFNDLLQGRAPGVLSFLHGGVVGRSGRIRIRGLNSINASNDPIIVVDGVRVESGAANGGAAGFIQGIAGAGGGAGRLSDIDPNEIASVEVVKGPSAATLYGTDAANGVIVITTKRGQPGQARWSVFTEQGILEQSLDIEDLIPDPYYTFGHDTQTDAPMRCPLHLQAAGTCAADSLASFNAATHPETRPFKNGYRQQYGLQVSGGLTEGATYFLSGDFQRETGTMKMPDVDQALARTVRGVSEIPDWQVRPNAFSQVNLRANVTLPLGNRGQVSVNTGFISKRQRQPAALILLEPATQVGYRDANDGWLVSGSLDRPYRAFAWTADDDVRRFVGSLNTDYAPMDWLSLRGKMGIDLSHNSFGSLLRRDEGPSSVATGQRAVSELGTARYSFDLGGTASRHLSSALTSRTSVGLQYNVRAQRGVSVIAEDLALGGETLGSGTPTVLPGFYPGEATLTTAVAGGYIEELLGFRDRFFVTGAVRFDGASTFGEGVSLRAYPKASASWVLSSGETGLQLPGVSALRLRAAYGTSGVQPGPIDALERVVLATGITAAGTPGPIGNIVVGNPDLKPERSSEVEAGFDLELWSSRVQLELTAYSRTSDDVLVSRPLPPDVAAGTTFGGATRIENLGSVRNRGLELTLNADLLQAPTFGAGVTVTASLNQNRVLRLGEGVALRNPLAEFAQREVGYPLNSVWGRSIESYADANGNGIIETTEVVLSDTSTYLGPNFPTREATVGPYLRLFDHMRLSGLLQHRGGFYRINNAAYGSCSVTFATCRAMNDPDTPLDEQAIAAATQLGYVGPRTQDASFWILRELSLGFRLPDIWTRLVGARGGQMTVAGRNLAVLWKASDMPIESWSSTDGTSQQASSELVPPTYWLLRVQLTY